MKQAEDNLTRELPVTKPGRKPIGERPMTPAERKARSRVNTLGELQAQIDLARAEIREIVTHGTLEPEQLACVLRALDHLLLASNAIPRS